ncbi:GntR family transcriptional regulator [Celeribacter halophilus]|uniref:GntR family transcriptional regulator n=1 Tax=Celeribacter halophilus TaxID=576117 RepID=UPI001C096913|nr:GntR family transcriptional regulator [Celeribacter halophilus]MBU2891378.1 GntR family transcriptional regulator [Celeribacter halophilus]MDO6512394.1 GntR family transcriptional regulator [Celeribacter halophilus]
MAKTTITNAEGNFGHAEIETRGKRGRPRGQATQMVYDALRDEILTLEAKPGTYLDETLLEKRFGVSRTPIREALIRLQSDRLVRFSANRGHFVELISIEEVPRIFEAMDLYQAAVLRLAAQRHTPKILQELHEINEAYLAAADAYDHKVMTEMNHRFHLRIGEASGNSFLAEAYTTALNYTLRLTYLMFEKARSQPSLRDGYYHRVYDEHKEMLALIEQGEADTLEALSKEHTQLFCDRVSDFVNERESFRSKPTDFFSEPLS